MTLERSDIRNDANFGPERMAQVESLITRLVGEFSEGKMKATKFPYPPKEKTEIFFEGKLTNARERLFTVILSPFQPGQTFAESWKLRLDITPARNVDVATSGTAFNTIDFESQVAACLAKAVSKYSSVAPSRERTPIPYKPKKKRKKSIEGETSNS